MPSPMHGEIAVIGASVAGVAAADELRRLGHTGDILLVGDEPHLPYDRPPLSKGLLTGTIEPGSVYLREREHYDRQGITLRLGTPAVRLDGRRVKLADGRILSPDAVIIATGARARPFPGGAARDTVVTLRGLDDARRLQRRLTPGTAVVVVGAGFIGGEVAASLRELGLKVTLVEAAPLPLAQLAGEDAAAAILRAHVEAGIRVLCGTPVEGIEWAGDRERIILADGRQVDGDLVVVGLGAIPNTEWLADSGLDIGNGVRCDATGATGLPGVYAIGDVASWHDPKLGRHIRHEHWTSAREQARIAAAHVLGLEPAPSPTGGVPYFWSDQHGRRIQSLGHPELADESHVVHGSLDGDSFVVLYGRSGTVIGAVGYNAAAQLMRHRAAIATSAPLPTRA
ncbi:ferredoxin reductase [Actinomadura sp. NBRC 104412]|uniref:NAD(P)/FAD-dependent oxidoreductase n=1 Tax=Actinomadura sp. NBRC 104412 TaxID=3032203 RepID=UPI0024A4F1BE|nr:FAD-dependent oxidoreductase [Actinomadura sp. NBRC 104412]GLZ08137.1 ferredoxin reductase [Actinomadura sp. NBRC 104412]